MFFGIKYDGRIRVAKLRVAACAAVFLASVPLILSAQGIQAEFGKNRVQFKRFDWSFYETENFSVYFYMGGQDVGRFVVESAEAALQYVEGKLEYRINNRIQVLVYNTLSDMRQNNIGIGMEQYNTGGMTRIIGNKIFVYFDGNHAALERQLREGIAKVFLIDMMYGGNIQEALQNAVLLNLPDWYVEGLASYLGEEWSTDLDNRLCDGVLSGRYRRFSRLSGSDARFAGHSMWHYISEHYGPNAIPNILYLTRINRALESGFVFVLGHTLRELIDEWHEYYRSRYRLTEQEKQMPAPENRMAAKRGRERAYYQLRMSADGRYLAFASNEKGRYKVKILDTVTGKNRAVLRKGYKTTEHPADHSFPLLAWSPEGTQLALVYEHKDKVRLLIHDPQTRKTDNSTLEYFQKVTGLSYGYNSRTLVMSVVNRGQSDISLFYIASHRVEKITNDFYDDLDPAYVKLGGREGILFISNRPHDTLRTDRFDVFPRLPDYNVFFYDYRKRPEVLLRVTHTPSARESLPMQYDAGHFAYLGDGNGIRNRYAGYIDSVFSHYDTLVYYRDSVAVNPPLDPFVYAHIPNDSIDSVQVMEVFKDTAFLFPSSDYARSVLEQSVAAGKSADLILHEGKYCLYINPLPPDPRTHVPGKLNNTLYRSSSRQQQAEGAGAPADTTLTDTTARNLPAYYFQSDIEPPAGDTAAVAGDTVRTGSAAPGQYLLRFSDQDNTRPFKITRVAPYKTAFSTDYVISQLDNSLIFTGYENFAAGGGLFIPPGLHPLIKLSISDLMEDYRFVGGFRLPTNLSGTDLFISYEALKKRADKKILYYRHTEFRPYDFNQPEPVYARLKTHYLEGRMKWPFSEVASLRGYAGYRADRVVFQSTSLFSLELPDYKENWFFLRSEFVFDNTISMGLNLPDGMRFKLYLEAQKQVNELKLDPPELQPEGSNMFLGGGDLRHYLKLHKQVIWANRLAFAHSFGPRKIVYYLGGVDNWIPARFDTRTNISADQGYAYQALATNMRGFPQNVRNGNTFAVLNSELRVPLLRYLNVPLSGEFWKNLQVVGFADIGSAWIGASPFSKDNPFNTTVINQGPVVVKVSYFRNPVVYGYGMGAHLYFIGYFLRFDVAWGVDDNTVTRPLYYFSVSLDF